MTIKTTEEEETKKSLKLRIMKHQQKSKKKTETTSLEQLDWNANKSGATRDESKLTKYPNKAIYLLLREKSNKQMCINKKITKSSHNMPTKKSQLGYTWINLKKHPWL